MEGTEKSWVQIPETNSIIFCKKNINMIKILVIHIELFLKKKSEPMNSIYLHIRKDKNLKNGQVQKMTF